ncbi:MAG: TonB-dependent receptor [Halioglobus sp.]
MKTPIFKPSILALAVASAPFAVLNALPAGAQPMLEEVIVTARKKPESLMDAPLSVTAVSGSNMDELGITDLGKLSTQVPGLTLGGGAQVDNIYIRGIGSGVNKGFEQSAGLYVDGIYQSRSRQFSSSMVDLQQVEVLRGPQSILFGKNTIAGAIKVETANPHVGDGFEGSVTADFEPDQETARGTVVLSGDLTDTLAARVAFRYQETDGYVYNNVRDADEMSKEDTLARLTLVWQPSDTVDITGKVSYLDMEGEGNTRVNVVADPSLLATRGQPGNSLGLTDVIGVIAAFAVPDYQEATGSKEYDSWLSNEGFYPGGTDTDEVEFLQTSLNVNWDIGDYTITSLTGYTDWDNTRVQDVDFHGGNVAGNVELETLEQISQELRIASNFDGRFNFVAGAYYEQQEGTIGGGQTVVDGSLGGVFGALPANALVPGAPDGLTLSDLGINSLWNGNVLAALGIEGLSGAEIDFAGYESNNDVDNETMAVFANVTFDITEALTLEVGGRYSDDSKEYFKTNAHGQGVPGSLVINRNSDGSLTEAGAADPLNAALNSVVIGGLLSRGTHEVNLDRSETNFDPSVKLLWNAGDDSLVYLSWSTGFKSGGFTGDSSTINPDGTPGPGTDFDDETAEAWELGVKSTLWGGRARIGANVFFTEVEDLQVGSFQGITFTTSNAGAMTSQGVEVESQVALTESLEIGVNLAYLNAEYDEHSAAACTIYQTAATVGTCTQDLAGETLPFAPELSGNLYAQYDYSLGDNLLLRLRGDANYKDEYFTDGDLDPNTLQESFWNFNARVGLGSNDGKWEVAAYGRNLTDERVITFSLDAPLSAGIYANGIAEPRVYGIQATYNF